MWFVWRRDMAAVFFLPVTPKQTTSKMEELRQLTTGQKAVVDAYIANYEPSESFDMDSDVLVDSQQMMLEMGTMCNFDENMLCDYLVERGFQAHYMKDDALSGWILREKTV